MELPWSCIDWEYELPWHCHDSATVGSAGKCRGTYHRTLMSMPCMGKPSIVCRLHTQLLFLPNNMMSTHCGGGVQEAVKLQYTTWWGTKSCSRGGIISGNYRVTGLRDAVAATHSVVVVAVVSTSLRSPAGENQTSCPQAQNKVRSRTGARLTWREPST